MKALFVLIFSLVFLCGCGSEEKTMKGAAGTDEEYTGFKETVKNVFDDNNGSTYIRVEKTQIYGSEKAIVEIMEAKAKWSKKFPNKKVVSISVVTGSRNNGESAAAVVCGLLIHYETDKTFVERENASRGFESSKKP